MPTTPAPPPPQREETERILNIRIVEAKDVIADDESANLFCRVMLTNPRDKKFLPKTTGILKRTNRPVWNQDFSFLFRGVSSLIVGVYGYHRLSKAVLLGRCAVEIQSSVTKQNAGEVVGTWFELYDRTFEKKTGSTIFLRHFVQDLPESTGALALGGFENEAFVSSRTRQLNYRFLDMDTPDVLNLTVFCATFNLGSEPLPVDLKPWIPEEEYDIFAIGAQEAVFAVGKDMMGKPKFNSCGAEWRSRLTQHFGNRYTMITATSTRGGIRLAVFVRVKHANYISVVDSASVTTTFNKGGAAISFFYKHTSFAFVNCHLSAHQNKTAARNAEVRHLIRSLKLKNTAPAQLDTLRQFHHVFWMGDLNYRLNFGDQGDALSPSETQFATMVQKIQANSYDELFAYDQLQAEMKEGRVFAEFQETAPQFPPTFKVERCVPVVYTKQRSPAWCDRVLWWSAPTVKIKQAFCESAWRIATSDHKPVSALFHVEAWSLPPSYDDELGPCSMFVRSLECHDLRKEDGGEELEEPVYDTIEIPLANSADEDRTKEASKSGKNYYHRRTSSDDIYRSTLLGSAQNTDMDVYDDEAPTPTARFYPSQPGSPVSSSHNPPPPPPLGVSVSVPASPTHAHRNRGGSLSSVSSGSIGSGSGSLSGSIGGSGINAGIAGVSGSLSGSHTGSITGSSGSSSGSFATSSSGNVSSGTGGSSSGSFVSHNRSYSTSCSASGSFSSGTVASSSSGVSSNVSGGSGSCASSGACTTNNGTRNNSCSGSLTGGSHNSSGNSGSNSSSSSSSSGGSSSGIIHHRSCSSSISSYTSSSPSPSPPAATSGAGTGSNNSGGLIYANNGASNNIINNMTSSNIKDDDESSKGYKNPFFVTPNTPKEDDESNKAYKNPFGEGVINVNTNSSSYCYPATPSPFSSPSLLPSSSSFTGPVPTWRLSPSRDDSKEKESVKKASKTPKKLFRMLRKEKSAEGEKIVTSPTDLSLKGDKATDKKSVGDGKSLTDVTPPKPRLARGGSLRMASTETAAGLLSRTSRSGSTTTIVHPSLDTKGSLNPYVKFRSHFLLKSFSTPLRKKTQGMLWDASDFVDPLPLTVNNPHRLLREYLSVKVCHNPAGTNKFKMKKKVPIGSALIPITISREFLLQQRAKAAQEGLSYTFPFEVNLVKSGIIKGRLTGVLELQWGPPGDRRQPGQDTSKRPAPTGKEKKFVAKQGLKVTHPGFGRASVSDAEEDDNGIALSGGVGMSADGVLEVVATVGNWQAVRDTQGKIWYYNVKTHISSWDQPSEFSGALNLEPELLATINGWHVMREKVGNRLYYRNSLISTWDVPAEIANAPELATLLTDKTPDKSSRRNNSLEGGGLKSETLPPPPIPLRRCSSCSTEARSTSQECATCGHPLEEAVAETPPPNTRIPSNPTPTLRASLKLPLVSTPSPPAPIHHVPSPLPVLSTRPSSLRASYEARSQPATEQELLQQRKLKVLADAYLQIQMPDVLSGTEFDEEGLSDSD